MKRLEMLEPEKKGPFLGEPFVKFQEKWSCSSLLTFQYLDFATLRCLEKVKHILPTGGLMLIYHGTIRKKNTLNRSKNMYCTLLSHPNPLPSVSVPKNIWQKKPLPKEFPKQPLKLQKMSGNPLTEPNRPTKPTNKQPPHLSFVCCSLLKVVLIRDLHYLEISPHLDVPGRKLGSKVIGSVGYFTPRNTPFLSWEISHLHPFTTWNPKQL